MRSLQFLTTQEILSDIPINADTTPAIDDFILSYLKIKPQLGNKILQNGIYSVYYRSRDPYTTEDPDLLMPLLKTFYTSYAAEQWVMTYGQNIIKEAEELDLHVLPLVLTIIYDANVYTYINEIEYETNYMWQIAVQQYPIYTFSKEGFQMALDEHFWMVKNNEQNNVIPYWIHYVEHGVARRLNTQELNSYISDYSSIDQEEYRQSLKKIIKIL